MNPVNVSPPINPGHLNLTSMLVTLTPGPASVACRMWSQSGGNLRLLMNAIVASQRLTAFSSCSQGVFAFNVEHSPLSVQSLQ